MSQQRRAEGDDTPLADIQGTSGSIVDEPAPEQEGDKPEGLSSRVGHSYADPKEQNMVYCLGNWTDTGRRYMTGDYDNA